MQGFAVTQNANTGRWIVLFNGDAPRPADEVPAELPGIVDDLNTGGVHSPFFDAGICERVFCRNTICPTADQDTTWTEVDDTRGRWVIGRGLATGCARQLAYSIAGADHSPEVSGIAGALHRFYGTAPTPPPPRQATAAELAERKKHDAQVDAMLARGRAVEQALYDVAECLKAPDAKSVMAMLKPLKLLLGVR